MNPKPQTWLLLILTLPTESATARMRFWRALKAMGCAVLRDGVYVLPADDQRQGTLIEMADAINGTGGTAHVIAASGRDRAQDEYFRSLFDRTEDYAGLARSLRETRKSLSKLSTSEVSRQVGRLRREFEALRVTDYFPNEATLRAEAGWTDFLGLVDTVLSPDEPHSADAAISRLNRKQFKGRIWATRRHLWIDRVASAWLIRRFIDPKARFLWLEKPGDCPKAALGFDFDGAAFTHVGERVTFEVLLAAFGLDGDAGLLKLGALVHALDIGGAVVAEASGFEALMTGARQRATDDDALLEDMSRTLDSLYAFYSGSAVRERRP